MTTTAPATLETRLETAAATEAWGAKLAPLLPRPCMLFLQGELGSGKTTLARGILRGLGVPDDVPSPSFPLLQTYNKDGLMFAHIDLYRCAQPQEWHEAGLLDAIEASALCMIEWPAKAAGLGVPDLDLTLRDAEDSGRVLAVAAGTAPGSACLARL